MSVFKFHLSFSYHLVLILNISLVRTVTKMLIGILNICDEEELENVHLESLAARRQIIKNKILAVGYWLRLLRLLRYVIIFPAWLGLWHQC